MPTTSRQVKPIELPYEEIQGLVSAPALAEHYALYLGYCDTLLAIAERRDRGDLPSADATKGDPRFRGAKQAEGHALGGVLLHEAYFLGLTPRRSEPDKMSSLTSAIHAEWGGYVEWWQEMRAAAMAARGWAVLAMQHARPRSLRVLLLDSHELGAAFGWEPILALDVFEHAYWVDWGTNRAGYLDEWLRHVNWGYAEEIHGYLDDGPEKERRRASRK